MQNYLYVTCSYSTATGPPTMTPEQLKKFIFDSEKSIPANMALITAGGLPACGKTAVLMSVLQEQFSRVRDRTSPEDLQHFVEVNDKFSFFELAAVQDKTTNKWQWYPFTKRSGYISCFVSALESDCQQDRGKIFDTQSYKQYIFDDKVLDNCFYELYQLLSSLYHDPAKSVLVDQLGGGARLCLVNVWDIGFNKAVLHFLTVIAGYLHHSFPILALSLDDTEHLRDHIDTSKLKGLEPILHQYSRASFLLQFSHLGRSVDYKRENVCKIAAIVNPESEPPRDPYPVISEKLHQSLSETVEKFQATSLIEGSPWIIDPEDQNDLELLKKNVDKLVANEKQKSDLPLSWFFLRSAFFKTGQLYIKTEELKECAKKCKITDESFKKFLHKFSGVGSIIHIPDIPVLCNYVILNPVDFFHKLSELFYPRFNGDLRYGIASLSTLRRMFGGDLQFFYDVLTACTFAVEIDSKHIEYAETQRHLPIAEKCLYIPGIRTGEDPTDSTPRANSLLLVYGKAIQPTHITVNAVKFLVENVPNLSLLTCDRYNVTKFHYYPPGSSPNRTVSLEMISHGDKNEIRITDDGEGTTDIKKQVILAYCHAIENYRKRHLQLLKCEPELVFALTCSNNPVKHHYVRACGQPACEFCKDDDTFLKQCKLWKELLEELESMQ